MTVPADGAAADNGTDARSRHRRPLGARLRDHHPPREGEPVEPDQRVDGLLSRRHHRLHERGVSRRLPQRRKRPLPVSRSRSPKRHRHHLRSPSPSRKLDSKVYQRTDDVVDSTAI